MTLLKFIKRNKYGNLEELVRSIPGLLYDPAARWNDCTSLGAGTATFPLLKVFTAVQASNAVSLIRQHLTHLTVRAIGGGTNLVGADRVIPDMVFMRLMPGSDFTNIERGRNGLFLAGAALSLKNILDVACALSFGGAAGLYGIPGTIGGAAVMNAGANGQCVGDFIEWVDMMDLTTGTVKRVRHKGLLWGYRRTSISENQIVLRVAFRFRSVVPEEETVLMKREQLRRMRAPAGRSAGSIFRNPSPLLPAGRILEKCGAKQLDAGRFIVSPDHANWIINRSDRKELPPSEKSFLETLNAMADKVYRTTGIILTPEVRFIDMQTANDMGASRPPIDVLVLKGGISSEREVSLLSAANVANTLRDAGFHVNEYDIRDLTVTPDMRRADVVYPVLHGGFGEDGTLQKILEDAGIRTVGSPSSAMKIAMDKTAAKKVMDEHGIRNPKYAVITDASAPIPAGMELPLIVKPNSEGSTFGLTLVEDPSQWAGALETALKYDKKALVEEYIAGVEATVGILLGKALPLMEIRYPGKLYDYEAKYTPGATKEICPPTGISAEAQEEAKKLALAFAKAIGAETLLRVDVIIRASDDKVFVLEGNSMPGCTSTSLLPQAALAGGISLMELYSGLVMNAYRKK